MQQQEQSKERKGSGSSAHGKSSRRRALKSMCENLWGPVLSSLSHVVVHCSDPLLVTTACDGYKNFALVAAVLGEL